MRYIAKLLGLIATATAVVPLVQLPAQSEAIEGLKSSILASDQESEERHASHALKLCQNLQPIHTLKGHLSPVTELEVTPDGRTLITSGGDIKIWDVETGELRHSLSNGLYSTSNLQITEDSRYLFGSKTSDGKEIVVSMWDIQTREIVRNISYTSFPGWELGSWWISQDGQKIFVSQYEVGKSGLERDVKVDIWDIEANKKVNTITSSLYVERRGGEIRSIPNSTYLISDGSASFFSQIKTI